MAGVPCESRVVHRAHRREPHEVLRDDTGRRLRALDPDAERSEATEQEPGLERSQSVALGVAPRGQLCVELRSPRRDDACRHVAVPREPLRRGVQDDVRAVIERALEPRCRRRSIHDDECSRGARRPADGPQVRDLEPRIRRSLYQDEARSAPLRESRLERGAAAVFVAGEIDVLDVDAVQVLVQEALRSAIEVAAADDALTGPRDAQDRGDRCHSAREAEGVRGAF